MDRQAAGDETLGMILEEEIAAMQLRIAKAESERDSWRVSGMQEKYLEAYSMVEALELQLDLLRQAARLGARP
jgi:hypothetical protein